MRNILPLSQSTFCSWGVGMSWFCSVCEKSFSRKDGMQRHTMSKHRNAGLTPFQAVPMFSQKCQRFHFEHPFTSIIAGITGCSSVHSPHPLQRNTWVNTSSFLSKTWQRKLQPSTTLKSCFPDPSFHSRNLITTRPEAQKDDHKAHVKQLRKRRHKKFKPYKYSMGEEDED